MTYPSSPSNPHDQAHPQWLPILLLTLTVLFWSGNFILGRGIRELIPPVSLNFWRWAGALAILIPFGLPRIVRQRQLMMAHWKFLALMSIPSITIFNTFIYTALQSSTAVNTVLVNAMVPVFIPITAWLIFKETIQVRQATGIVISLVGLLVVITRADLNTLLNLGFSRGDLWTLGAGISWAIYSVMLRHRPPEMDPIGFLTAIVGLGLLFCFPFYLWELSEKGGFSISLASLASIGYVSIFPSVLSFIFWNRGVDMVGANRAGIFFHLMPVFSIVLAIVFLDERLQLFHLLGMGLIFIGIGLTTFTPSRKRADSQEISHPLMNPD